MGNTASGTQQPSPPLTSAFLLNPAPFIGHHLKANTYNENSSQDGNVDFVMVNEQGGIAWVADTVGHNWGAEKKELKGKIEAIWKDWDKNWREGPFTDRGENSNRGFLGSVFPKSVPWEKAKQKLHEWLFRLSNAFEEIAISSTFTLICLVDYKEDQYSPFKRKGLISVQVGDSGAMKLSKLPPEGPQAQGVEVLNDQWVAEPLTHFIKGEVSHIELAGDVRKAVIQLQPVEPGDIIIGGTDGVWNPLMRKYESVENLEQFLSPVLHKSPHDIADIMWDTVEEAAREEQIERMKVGKGTKGDDVTIFVVKIPE